MTKSKENTFLEYSQRSLSHIREAVTSVTYSDKMRTPFHYGCRVTGAKKSVVEARRGRGDVHGDAAAGRVSGVECRVSGVGCRVWRARKLAGRV